MLTKLIFKLQAISHAVKHGNRAAEREFNTNESMNQWSGNGGSNKMACHQAKKKLGSMRTFIR